MGWRIFLHVTCQLRPEYIDFVCKEYLKKYPVAERLQSWKEPNDSEDSASDSEESWSEEELGPNDSVPPAYRNLIQTWIDLDIGSEYYSHSLTDSGLFTCRIEKKATNHTKGDLWETYVEFLKHIIVPISYEITYCRISEDDVYLRDEMYTDRQLRNIPFTFNEWLGRVEHIYDGDMIVETRVIWKRPFKRSLELDVTRMFQ